jgi:hypothetical protein
MTVIDDSLLPTDRAATEVWLAAREEEVAALVRTTLRRIISEAFAAYEASLTASGDLAALDSIATEWSRFVYDDLAPALAETNMAGSMAAWLGMRDEPSTEFTKGWTSVVNQNAVSYADQHVPRIVDVGNRTRLQVRQVVSNGIRDGLSVEDMKGKIGGVSAFSEFRADTIARTETVGAYVQGDMAGARALGDHGPVEKVWVATLDRRTRESHAEAHNQCMTMDEPFDVGGVPMDSPHAPGAPPGEVVNCRCYVEMLYDGDTRPDGTTIGADELPGVTPPDEIDPASLSLKDRIESMKSGVMGNRHDKFSTPSGRPRAKLMASEQRLREIGKVVDDSVQDALAQRGMLSPRQIDEQINTLRDAKIEALDRAIVKRAEALGYRDIGKPLDFWSDHKDLFSPGDTLNDLRSAMRSYDPDFRMASKRLDDAYKTQGRISTSQYMGDYSTEYSAEWRRQMADVRRMGGVNWEQSLDTPSVRAKAPWGPQNQVKPIIDRGGEMYPQAWNQKAGWNDGKMWVGDIDGDMRGWQLTVRHTRPGTVYDAATSAGRGMINIPVHRFQDGYDLMVHEMGHRMEAVTPAIKANEWAFKVRRAAGEVPSKLSDLVPGSTYRDAEVAVKDHFLDPYTGKVYGNTAEASSEVLTMGTQGMVTGKFGFYTDDDWRTFVLGLLAAI